eukprot:3957241-Prymnesium_polylepis.2
MTPRAMPSFAQITVEMVASRRKSAEAILSAFEVDHAAYIVVLYTLLCTGQNSSIARWNPVRRSFELKWEGSDPMNAMRCGLEFPMRMQYSRPACQPPYSLSGTKLSDVVTLLGPVLLMCSGPGVSIQNVTK